MATQRISYEKSEYPCIREEKAWSWASCSKCKIFRNCPAIKKNAVIAQCGICKDEIAVGKDYKKKLDQVIQAARDVGAKETGYLCNECRDKTENAEVIQM